MVGYGKQKYKILVPKDNMTQGRYALPQHAQVHLSRYFFFPQDNPQEAARCPVTKEEADQTHTPISESSPEPCHFLQLHPWEPPRGRFPFNEFHQGTHVRRGAAAIAGLELSEAARTTQVNLPTGQRDLVPSTSKMGRECQEGWPTGLQPQLTCNNKGASSRHCLQR